MKSFFRCLTLLILFAFSTNNIVCAQATKWREMHKVKKKETIFGIAKEYGITIEDLIEANPEMNTPGYELKKDDYIYIPYAKKNVNATVSTPKGHINDAKTPSLATVKTNLAVKVGVMLPLHDDNGDGRRMLEYYRGILLACDQLRRQGISIDVQAWNVPIDADIRMTLLSNGASNCDIIFGPLYSSMVTPLGDFCKQYDIKMVIPFSITGYEVASNPNIFQVYQNPQQVTDSSIKAFLNRFSRYHVVFIDCNDPNSDKGTFTFSLRKQLDSRGIDYSITNLKSSSESFAKAFSSTKPNVVVLNTARSPELNTAFTMLSKLTGKTVSLFGYTEWLMYEKYDEDNFFKYDTYIPTTFYYNPMSADTRVIETNYHTWFKKNMLEALPRFAITGYDHAMFFIKGYSSMRKAFKGVRGTVNYKPLQTPLNFKRVGNGGMQNTTFMLVHYLKNRTIESINY